MRVIFVVEDFNAEYMGIMYISALLKTKGFKTEAVQGEYNRIKKRLQHHEPTILAYSTPTVLLNKFLYINRRIKEEFKVFSVFGGPHATFCPEMIEDKGVDAVCMGEGEYAMAELAVCLDNSCSPRTISNLWIKEEGNIYKNSMRPLISQLDELPFPDRSLFAGVPSFRKGQIAFSTNRGCPYDCSYCFNPLYDRLYGNDERKVRHRSVDNLISEIKEVRNKNGLRLVYFSDDTFIFSRVWLEEFSFKYKEKIGLPFYCLVRPNLIAADTVRLLKDAGCALMLMGVECGDDYYLEKVLKRGMTAEQILNAARTIKSSGVRFNTYNMIGLPGSSFATEMKTLDLNIKCRPNYAKAMLLSVYPGTRLCFDRGEKKLADGRFESQIFGGHWILSRTFKSPLQKRRLENLYHFFPIVCKCPFLFYFVGFLSKLPVRPLLFFIHLVLKGFSFWRVLPYVDFSGRLKSYFGYIHRSLGSSRGREGRVCR